MFRLYNKLDDGKLLRSEVLDLMREGLEENRLKLKVSPEKVVDEVVAIVTSSRSRPRTRKRTTRTPTGDDEEFLYWKEFRRLIEIQHESSSFAQPAHKTTSVALLTKSNAYWTKETDFNVRCTSSSFALCLLIPDLTHSPSCSLCVLHCMSLRRCSWRARRT
jgi:hypothetical protein